MEGIILFVSYDVCFVGWVKYWVTRRRSWPDNRSTPSFIRKISPSWRHVTKHVSQACHLSSQWPIGLCVIYWICSKKNDDIRWWHCALDRNDDTGPESDSMRVFEIRCGSWGPTIVGHQWRPRNTKWSGSTVFELMGGWGVQPPSSFDPIIVTPPTSQVLGLLAVLLTPPVHFSQFEHCGSITELPHHWIRAVTRVEYP